MKPKGIFTSASLSIYNLEALLLLNSLNELSKLKTSGVEEKENDKFVSEKNKFKFVVKNSCEAIILSYLINSQDAICITNQPPAEILRLYVKYYNKNKNKIKLNNIENFDFELYKKIVLNFNVNCFISHNKEENSIKYYYLNDIAAKEVDLILQKLLVDHNFLRKGPNKYQDIGFDPTFLKSIHKDIMSKVNIEMIQLNLKKEDINTGLDTQYKENQENVIDDLLKIENVTEQIKFIKKIKKTRKHRESVFNLLQQNVTKIFYNMCNNQGTEIGLNQFIRSYLTSIQDIIKKQKSIAEKHNKYISYDDSIQTNDGCTWKKIKMSITGLSITLGKSFLDSYYKEFLLCSYQEYCKKQRLLYLITLFNEIIKQLPETLSLGKGDKKYPLKENASKLFNDAGIVLNNTLFQTLISNADRKHIFKFLRNKTHTLSPKVLQLIITLNYYSNKDKEIMKENIRQKTVDFDSFWKKSTEKNELYNDIILFIENYLEEQMAKINNIVGFKLLNYFEKVIQHDRINDPTFILVNAEFYRIIEIASFFPSFGPEMIKVDDTNRLLSEEKTIKLALKNNKASLVRHSKKYDVEVKYISKTFYKHLIFLSNNYRCRLNYIAVRAMLNSIYSFLTGKKDLDENILRYFLPEETDLALLKVTTNNDNDYKKLKFFLVNFNDFNYKKFMKDNVYYNLNKLLQANTNYKYEFVRILGALNLIIPFYCWYPHIWIDGRGRQNPDESALTITKSPRWRHLFYYETALSAQKELSVHLKDNMDNLQGMLDIQNKKEVELETKLFQEITLIKNKNNNDISQK